MSGCHALAVACLPVQHALGDLVVEDRLHHVGADDLLAFRDGVDQAVHADLVDDPRHAARALGDPGRRLVGERVRLEPRRRDLGAYVLDGVLLRERREPPDVVNALRYGLAALHPQLLPELLLPAEHQGHGASGVEILGVEQEPDLLERLVVQQVRLVDHHDDLLARAVPD